MNTTHREWQERSLARLESIKHNLDKKELKRCKLHNLERIVRRVVEFAENCAVCQQQQHLLDELIDALGGPLQSSKIELKVYYKKLRTLTTHMTRKHNLRAEGSFLALGLALGPAIGVSLGTAMQNIGVGIAIGTGLGIALGSGLEARAKREGRII
jgi:hypothetical protein